MSNIKEDIERAGLDTTDFSILSRYDRESIGYLSFDISKLFMDVSQEFLAKVTPSRNYDRTYTLIKKKKNPRELSSDEIMHLIHLTIPFSRQVASWQASSVLSIIEKHFPDKYRYFKGLRTYASTYNHYVSSFHADISSGNCGAIIIKNVMAETSYFKELTDLILKVARSHSASMVMMSDKVGGIIYRWSDYIVNEKLDEKLGISIDRSSGVRNKNSGNTIKTITVNIL